MGTKNSKTNFSESVCQCVEPCPECNCSPASPSSQGQSLPRINSALRYGLKAFKSELIKLEWTRQVSSLVDICDLLLDLATEQDRQGVQHG